MRANPSALLCYGQIQPAEPTSSAGCRLRADEELLSRSHRCPGRFPEVAGGCPGSGPAAPSGRGAGDIPDPAALPATLIWSQLQSSHSASLWVFFSFKCPVPLLTPSYIKLVLTRSKINRAKHFTKAKYLPGGTLPRDSGKHYALYTWTNKGKKTELPVINAMGHISSFVGA